MSSKIPPAILLLLFVLPVAARPPDDSGSGFTDARAHSDSLTREQRLRIERELEQSSRQLEQAGLLQSGVTSIDPYSLGWPLSIRAGFEFDDYHGVSNFVDLDPDYPGQLLDYMCNERTYDLASGYNHAGVDYFLWPYPWRMMDQEMVEIVAVAPGTILARHDGNDDRNCSFGGDDWNAVYVQHADGSVAWYGHMKKHSLTSKGVGETVAAGEFLGLVGSSGNSTGPHLHLELRASSEVGAAIHEAHAGACRAGDSLWQAQRPYYDTALNGLGVHDAEPSMVVDCPDPGQEAASLADQIALGSPVWLSIYLRDVIDTQPVVELALYRPDGQLFHQWQFDFNPPQPTHYAGGWWWWRWNTLGSHPDLEGTWRFEVSMGNQTLERTFVHGQSGTVFDDRFETLP